MNQEEFSEDSIDMGPADTAVSGRKDQDALSNFIASISTVAEVRFALGLIDLLSEVSRFCPKDGLSFALDGCSGEYIVKAQDSHHGVRSDFVFACQFGNILGEVKTEAILIVEIDDPSHWRDPEKAAADRERDRLFVSKYNVPTMRFSNEEVFRDRQACGKEIVRFLKRYSKGLDRSMNLQAGCWMSGNRTGESRAASLAADDTQEGSIQ